MASWIVSLIIGIFLYTRNKLYDRWNAIFLVTFTTIQLLEAGIWFSIERKNKDANSTLTKIIIVALFAQPLIQTYLGYLYTGSSILYFLSWLFVGLWVWSIYAALTMDNVYSFPGKFGHLVWDSLKRIPSWILLLYIGGLFIPLLFMESGLGLPLIAVGGLTALYSWMSGADSFASLWCLTACVYGVVAIAIK